MPHVIIEYSDNITRIDFRYFFAATHQALADIAVIDSCKSRAICLEHYHIGLAKKNHAIFAVTIKLMPERNHQQKNKMATDIEKIINQQIIVFQKNILTFRSFKIFIESK